MAQWKYRNWVELTPVFKGRSERHSGLQEPQGTCHDCESEKCSYDVASVNMHNGFVGLNQNQYE